MYFNLQGARKEVGQKRWSTRKKGTKKKWLRTERTHPPLVAVKVLELNAKHVVVVVGQHVNVLVAEPELAAGIAETVFVIVPILVEVLRWYAEVVSPVDHLSVGRSFFIKVQG